MAISNAEAQRRWRERHPEKARVQDSARAKRPGNRARRAAWKAEHPELQLDYARASCHTRRARLKGGGRYTREEWEAILEAYGHRCRICAEPGRMTVDHIVAISKGGTNTADNLQPLCALCNSRKGAA